MQVLYPRDWDEVGHEPQIILYEPNPSRKLKINVVEINADNNDTVTLSKNTERRSKSGLTRSIKLINLNKPGNYALQIISESNERIIFTMAIRQLGRISFPDMNSALDSIENIYHLTHGVRFLSNGIGKSGTSWLYYLLGSLPGVTSADMPGLGFSGVNYAELKDLPYRQVYHGHLGCCLEVVDEVESNDYRHVYIRRDLRDLIVSEYFHKFHLSPAEHRPDLKASMKKEDMLEYDMIFRWSSSIYAASTAMDWHKSGKCVTTSYEALSEYGNSELSRILSEIHLPCHDDLIEYMKKRCEFSNFSGGRARGQEEASSFFRNGVVGDWRRHLSEDTARRLYDRYQDYNTLFGYTR